MVKDNITIGVLQKYLFWEKVAENRSSIGDYFSSLTDCDLVVLPEMFTSGFTMNPENVAERMEGTTVNWMKYRAQKYGFAIVGSIAIAENNNYYNRLLFVHPNGNVEYYNKRHLFRMAKENQLYSAGTERLIVNLHGWKICPLICYDLRFPVWSRNKQDYDLLLYVANWPEKRSTHWNKLLQARAIENQAYVVAANRIGCDDNDICYKGESQIIAPTGEVLSKAINEDECIIKYKLKKSTIDDYRSSFPAFLDADDFSINDK